MRKIKMKHSKPTIPRHETRLGKLFSINVENVGIFNNKNGHVLLIAPSRSGKSVTFLSVMIELFGRCINFNEKPHLVITDPKMELMKRHSPGLIGEGYKIKCLNLKDKDMVYSHSFNPLDIIWDAYLEEFEKIKPYLDFEKIKECRGSSWLKEYYKQKNQIILENDIDDFNLQLVRTLVLNIGGQFFPLDADKNTGNSAYFNNGSRNFLMCGIWYLLEMAMLTGNKEKLSLGSVARLLNSQFVRNTDGENFLKLLKSLPPEEFLSENVPDGEEDNMSTFLEQVRQKLSNYSGVLRKLTAANTIDMLEFLDTRQPIALFLITPDYENNFNDLVGMFIDQLSTTLAEKGDKQGGIKRPVEFLLDEFVNVPPLPQIDTRFSVMLGRNVRYTIVIQNRKQLDKAYGNEIASTLVANCHHNICLGALTDEDREYVSKEIGETTVMKADVFGKKLKDIDPRWREEKQRLVSPSQIGSLDFGEGYSYGVGGTMSSTYVPYFVLTREQSMDCKTYFEKYNIPIVHNKLSKSELEFPNYDNPFNLNNNNKQGAN